MAQQAHPIATETTGTQHNPSKHHHHHDAGQQRTQPGAQQTQFWHAQLAIYQNVVAHDVQSVAAQQYPHGRLGIRDAVRELLEGIEQHDKQQRHEQHKVVGLNDGYQLIGLPQMLQVQIEHGHHRHLQQRHQRIGHEAATQG